MRQFLKHKSSILAIALLSVLFPVMVTATAYAAGDVCGGTQSNNTPVHTSIDLGCQGKGNPISDMTFAIIRFLTNGVGIVMVGSIIYAGIQYSVSRGDPQATANAIKRIQSTLIALLIFVFGYAILNYLIPAGFLK